MFFNKPYLLIYDVFLKEFADRVEILDFRRLVFMMLITKNVSRNFTIRKYQIRLLKIRRLKR